MFHFFLQLRTFLETAGALTGLIVSIALIFGVMIGVLYLTIKLKLPTAIAVIATSLGTIIFMVPATVSFSSLVDVRARNNRLDEIEKLNKEIAIKQLEHENLEKSNIITKKNIEIDSLDKQIALLKNTQASVAKMHDIAELALLKTNLKQTVVYDEAISEIEKNTILGLIDAGTSNDKILVVSQHDIDAKFGVDLKEIKIKKIDNNTVVISGITPKYLGSTKNKTTNPIKELRTYTYTTTKYSDTPIVSSITVKNDANSNKIVDGYVQKFEAEYQDSLQSGKDFGYLNEAVEQLARNFLSVILAPAYKNISFDNTEQEGAVQFEAYIQGEIDTVNKMKDTKIQEIKHVEAQTDDAPAEPAENV